MPTINGTKQLGDFEYQKFREDSEGKPAVAVVNPDGSNIGGGSASTKYVTLIDKTTTTNVVYIGKAVPTGAAIGTASAVWQITRIDKSSSPITIKYADGNTNFDNTFESLAGKTYN